MIFNEYIISGYSLMNVLINIFMFPHLSSSPLGLPSLSPSPQESLALATGSETKDKQNIP